ncbi:phage tail protein [Novipirellula rosea]|uniref:Tail fiber protein n=1 Tax=Novipirellula rosea TaxID=1031540 RepID=A0ABP8MRX8_9BACT
MSEPFVAEVKIFAGNFAPRGYAFCNGQLLPISQNTALFSLIGTTYGGDGRTTTALPNLQGRAPMHPGRGPGLNDRRLGERGGVETVTLTETEMPNHNHRLTASGEAEGEDNDSAGNYTGQNGIYAAAGNAQPMSDRSLENQGGNQPHDNMQPYLALSYIIALTGRYPSRA